MRVFSAIALSMFSAIYIAQAAKPSVSSACACLESIELPNLTPQLYYSDAVAGKPLMLAVKYNDVSCSNIAFHIKLQGVSSGTIGCLADPDKPNDNSNTATFTPGTASTDTKVFVRGASQNNQCGITVGQVCTPAVLAMTKPRVFELHITADGCSSERVEKFTCQGASTVTNAGFKRRHEIALDLPPRRMRCPLGTQACRTGGSVKFGFKWDCVQTDQIDSCGGCPGDENAVDCTELPGISAVQCIAKRCIIAQCRRGYELVNNKCVQNGNLNLSRGDQTVIREKLYPKRERKYIRSSTRLHSRETEGSAVVP